MARHHKLQKTSKHKKIKAIDPFYSGPRRDILFKDRKYSNKPPSDLTGQEIPRKVREMMKAKEQLKNKTPAQKSRSSARREGSQIWTQDTTAAQVPVFKKGKYEGISHFYRRMDKAAQESITKAELESQFDVKFERTGKNKLTLTNQKDPVLETEDGEKAEVVKSTKTKRRKEKLMQKMEERTAFERDEFDEFHDDIKFGEVVEAPPQINAAPRKAPEVKKAGDKRLLLIEALKPAPEPEAEKPRSLFDELPTLDTATVRALRREEARSRAVDTYRKLKKFKNNKKKA
ncbi:hypothetical protein RvY_05153 [Ramazzottius varieornatus]|uniref:Coiled-coil domain-containing protein 137 n=1 Tax=Ramazzottius varieornatus TaxID=947166 RepID=A0A1D1UU30_RAMVA|nr:hypothetical protein RvY_05153 [Ramazzottius varieornatus]